MSESTLRIGVLVPEVLGTYGDCGNAVVLARRAIWRGVDAEVVNVGLHQAIPTQLDIYTIGGGEDTAQALACDFLTRDRGLHHAVAAGRPVLAICAGMQILGQWYTDANQRQVAGAGLLDCTTEPQGVRSIGELVTQPLLPDLTEPLTGFENHGGATTLGVQAKPLGKVVAGAGNAASSGEDGCVQDSIVATYMHGPVLARNPQLADYLLARALGRDLVPLEHEQIRALREERFQAAHQSVGKKQ